MPKFYAYVAEKDGDNFSFGKKELDLIDLPEGEVTIRVRYSSVNFKDGLASTPNGRVLRSYPMVPGIDLAGEVVACSNASFQEGQPVLVTGYGLGVSHFGGFAEYARVPANWVVPLPQGLRLRDAMVIGTAGFTAGLAVKRMEENGLRPGQGPVLVVGATGGVGSIAVAVLANSGYEVTASTGKQSEVDYLKSLGASQVLSREEVSQESSRALEKELWAGAIDPVGGKTLAYLLRTTKYGGSVASMGNTGGPELNTTVFPFILRGVNLLGIDSVNCPMDSRLQVWDRLAASLSASQLDAMAVETPFDELPEALSAILKGGVRGRVVITL
ncbi:acryloyl-CoA reductase [Alicyclobacillus tolerans]|uniref:acrylyl-CoA reductase family protein n=1 Tax=Alicyclobacillus tolerans TaxID=90970 RepID=UPI001F0303B5|nr:acryloyl-CoA reductase [Alicyclobacillus tolerans]MCF8567197.1 acryloyl-CoA reductase [Alicyclobacillus tolerans]